MGWVKPDDAFLVRDLNRNGTIDGLHEMFGSAKQSGFMHLQAYDSNNDGTVDQNDAVYNELGVWQDANTDGKTDAGELRS